MFISLICIIFVFLILKCVDGYRDFGFRVGIMREEYLFFVLKYSKDVIIS